MAAGAIWALYITAGPYGWRPGPTVDGRALRLTAGPYGWRPGPLDDGRALLLTAGPYSDYQKGPSY